MSKIIIGIEVGHRAQSVQKVQELLTEYGCNINTRLGLHSASEEFCSPKGLILLELIDNSEDAAAELTEKLEALEDVLVKQMEF